MVRVNYLSSVGGHIFYPGNGVQVVEQNLILELEFLAGSFTALHSLILHRQMVFVMDHFSIFWVGNHSYVSS
jgi:hypothetical protein